MALNDFSQLIFLTLLFLLAVLVLPLNHGNNRSVAFSSNNIDECSIVSVSGHIYIAHQK